jgi:hypothetical protein
VRTDDLLWPHRRHRRRRAELLKLLILRWQMRAKGAVASCTSLVHGTPNEAQVGVDAGKTVVGACCSCCPAGGVGSRVRDPYEVQTVVALCWYVRRLLLRGRAWT